MKKPLNTLLISSLIIFSGQAQAGLIRDGVWQIEEGDSLKSILKTALPEQPLRQKRLKRLSPLLNRASFDTKGKLIVGNNLRLPGVKMPSNEVIPARNQIGRVLITNGATTALAPDGQQRVLNRGSAINKGDTIQTQAARAQVRFSDGSLLALRPNTEFKVEEYSFNGQQDGSERGIYNLLKGGFRTISGAIGKVNRNNYKVKTPVATIGIRGTHYGVTLCAHGSCADQGLADGLYGGVVDGSVQATNDGGSSIFNNDEYFLISDIGSVAQYLLAPPGVIFDDPDAPTSPQEQPSNKEKKEDLSKRIEKLVQHIFKDKRPDFDPSIDPDILGPLLGPAGELNTKAVHPTLPGTAATNGTVVGFSFIGSNPIHQIVSTEPAVGSVAQTIQHNGSTQNISTGSSATVGGQGGEGTPILAKSSTAAAVAMFDILQGLSYEEVISRGLSSIASIITDPAAQGAKLVEAGNVPFGDPGIDLTWGRWVDTPIKVETALASASSTPGTGVIFVLADSTKTVTDKSALLNTASRLSLSGTRSMQALGGIAPVSFTGQRGSGSSSLTLDFSQEKAMFSVNALINNDQYDLSTAAGGVSFDSIIAPGANANLTGTCSASAGGVCGASTALTGNASFIFTDTGVSAGGGGQGTLSTAVNYAGHGTVPNGTTVGIAGAEIFTSNCVGAC